MHALRRSVEHPGTSWRVGVSTMNDAAAGTEARGLSLFRSAVAQNMFRAAVMSVEIQDASEENAEEEPAGMTVHLWRAELLTAVVEVDRHNVIQKAGASPLHQAGACQQRCCTTACRPRPLRACLLRSCCRPSPPARCRHHPTPHPPPRPCHRPLLQACSLARRRTR